MELRCDRRQWTKAIIHIQTQIVIWAVKNMEYLAKLTKRELSEKEPVKLRLFGGSRAQWKFIALGFLGMRVGGVKRDCVCACVCVHAQGLAGTGERSGACPCGDRKRLEGSFQQSGRHALHFLCLPDAEFPGILEVCRKHTRQCYPHKRAWFFLVFIW